ncbi:NRDE family protein [Luteimonas sp. MC1782]|uniref:NRDE family protein n=1 Tax=Luteimonas sp. MC1782 TaxID=2760305 RepID=UPI0016034516|nr:NRDE family protein [Luteimonas sp. MC1782]MBB1471820.1 NRDE family protein [Luteimonas sp. MC1782]
MCLIALAWRHHPRHLLAIAANRDEFHARPTAPAALDPGAPAVYGGRDLVQGGGWLQVSAQGRLAAVTNVRDGRADATPAPRSRGWLVRDFVRGSDGPVAFAAARVPGSDYGPFNAVFCDGDVLVHASNRPRQPPAPVAAGVHAMSNGAFDAAWPKSTHATRALAAWLESPLALADPMAVPTALDPLFSALADETHAHDGALPDTGVGLELERALSPPFVRGPRYGTRCSSVVLFGAAAVVFAERRYGPDGVPAGSSIALIPLPANENRCPLPRCA